MGIRLAETAGFCWGVRRAVALSLRVAHQKNRTIYTYGPLIHNRQALDLLETKGIRKLPDDGDRHAPAPLLIRAHGVAPQVKRELIERGFDVSDATCPHVMRAQKIVARMSQQGCSVVIVGDRGHAEVDGLLGHANGRGYVIEGPEEVESLPPDLGRVAVVAQTTQGGDRWERCVEALRSRQGEVEIFNTRCNDTNSRQEELIAMTREVEAVIVVGGRGSANTARLAEIARQCGVPTWHVETADELPLAELRRFAEIGVTAGASTPHWIIEQVVDRLRAMQRERQPLWLRLPSAAGQFLILGQLTLAAGAGALTVAAARLMGIEYRLAYSALPFLYLWAMHLLHFSATLPRDLSLVSGPIRTFAAHRNLAWVAGLASLAGAVVLSAYMGVVVFALVTLSTVVGAVYSFGKVPRKFFPRTRFRQLHNIPGSKDLCVAAAWSMMVAVVPWVHAGGLQARTLAAMLPFAVTATFVFGLSLIRSVAVDLRQLEGDLLLGHETLPVFAGPQRTRWLLTIILGALALLALGGFVAAPLHSGLILLPTVALMAVASWLTDGQRIRSYYAWAFLLDLPFYVAVVLSLV